MKNSSTIRSLLLITQADMAQLLKVHRSQLSMFELGKRDLPRAAKLLLAPMLVHASKTSKMPDDEAEYLHAENLEFLKEQLEENKFKRLHMERKLEKVRDNYQKKLAILNLTAFLSKSAAHQRESYRELVGYIKSKASRMYGGCDATSLIDYEIKSELLELEKQLLEKYIAKHNKEKALK